MKFSSSLLLIISALSVKADFLGGLLDTQVVEGNNKCLIVLNLHSNYWNSRKIFEIIFTNLFENEKYENKQC